MRRSIALVAAGCAAILVLAGCINGPPPAEIVDGITGTGGDSALAAQEVAANAISATAPDATLVMLDSQGVVMSPPPSNWSFLYGSEQTGRTYKVSVNHGTAEDPEDLSELNLDRAVLAQAVEPSSVQVGADNAYELARAYVEKRDGTVPPNVMMSMMFVEMPGLDRAMVGKWSVAFLNGTSTEGMQQVLVDAISGKVTEAP